MKREDVDRNSLSPMMAQYMEIKDAYPDELLFYRLGDFYEMFFDDALIASRELELTLTGRVAGLEERVPMCGVPHHNVKPYIEKLVNKGYRVAICEQLEDPKSTKGMVKRGVIDVISKGTIADNELLNDKDSSYIAGILFYDDTIILTILDISTGYLGSLSINNNEEELLNKILEYNLKEVLLVDDKKIELIEKLKKTYNVEVTISHDLLWEKYDELYNKIADARIKTGVAHLFYYLTKRQLKDLSYIKDINIINNDDYLEMDVHSIRNLELIETLRLKERTYSLIWLLDKCMTAMGSRQLKSWLLKPLKNKDKIISRYDKIDKLNEEFIARENLKNALNEVYDMERLAGKTINGNLNARDLLQLKNSLKVLPEISKINKSLEFNYNIKEHQDLYDLLDKAINEDPPIGVKDGSIIKDGFNEELDNLRSIRSGGKNFVASFESKIKEETGIKNLRVGFNKVFGYYIEVPKGSINQVKEEFNWSRKQTLTNCERYISPDLKTQESMILNAEENIIDLEYKLFCDIREAVKKEVPVLNETARNLSELDAILALSLCSEEYNLKRPVITDKHEIIIKDGRHPVVEIVNKSEYVSNDCLIPENINTLLITGPNMSGKSTYMRQLAIIVIMAQMGSFVPASSATLPIIDKIFTRIGASDDLVSGESTFMVEMKEARNAISGATENSLVLFDELGRGTATYDGMSLAQAILEYISTKIKSFTLFSTHYHELTDLEKKYHNIKNIHVSAIENGNEITFLHKIQDGAVDKSYGIHVARLALMPEDLLDRASEILNEYENGENKVKKSKGNVQLSLDLESKPENSDSLKKKIEEIDILNTTPIDALNILYDLKKEIKK